MEVQEPCPSLSTSSGLKASGRYLGSSELKPCLHLRVSDARLEGEGHTENSLPCPLSSVILVGSLTSSHFSFPAYKMENADTHLTSVFTTTSRPSGLLFSLPGQWFLRPGSPPPGGCTAGQGEWVQSSPRTQLSRSLCSRN